MNRRAVVFRSGKRRVTTITAASSRLSCVSVRSDSIQHVSRSLIGRRGIQTVGVARSRASAIPAMVRRVGGTREFLAGVDNGHIRSVARFPAGARRASNQCWEISRLNRATGAGRKPVGYWQMNARAIKVHSWRVLAAGGIRAIGRGALYSALIAVPIEIWREGKLVRLGEKTVVRAMRDGGSRVAVSAALGGVASGCAFAATAVGLGVVIAPISIGALSLGLASGVKEKLSRRSCQQDKLDESSHDEQGIEKLDTEQSALDE